MREIRIGNIHITKSSPFFLIAGPCVIESEKIALDTAEAVATITSKLNIPYIYKSSYTKANRQSLNSYSGPGLDAGLKILEKVKTEFKIPVLTDIHLAAEAASVAEVADVLQIPAFLCRQTDIVVAAAKTGKVVNIKKGQFMAPEDMGAITEKSVQSGNDQIILTERGASFGYHNLVVDFRSLIIMKKLGHAVVFDATHSLQLPGAGKGISGGQPQFIFPLARAAVAVGVQGIFLETHPCVEKALCDAANMLPLPKLESLLIQLKEIDGVNKKFES